MYAIGFSLPAIFYVSIESLAQINKLYFASSSALFGVLFSHKQEAAFSSYRMFQACGSALTFGCYFLSVKTKVEILAASLAVSLVLYGVIEMKMQLQSQFIGDIVAL